MNYINQEYIEQGIKVEISVLDIPKKTKEYHLIFHYTNCSSKFENQVESLYIVLEKYIHQDLLPHTKPIFARCYLSDIVNQHNKIEKILSLLECSVSIIGQPMMDGSKIALWVIMRTNVEIIRKNEIYIVSHNGYLQSFFAERIDKKYSNTNIYDQTNHLLSTFEEKLMTLEYSLEANCLRTWFYINDIDSNYFEFAKARKENFEKNGLTTKTHFIASTGIEGKSQATQQKIMMDAYVIEGLDKQQIQYLYASDFMSSTMNYGVTFERGVTIHFGDRKNVFISGTASIDQNGNVVYAGDIEQQLLRMLQNVNALLDKAGCTFKDISMMIIYIRDIGDYSFVRNYFEKYYSKVPKLILLSSICRPEWLIEIECIASIPSFNATFNDY
jgi:enamine deaminase RidA (YjgF/YER057c/UK114 family)